MNKRIVIYIFLGAVVGGLFGSSYGAASGNPDSGIAVGAMAVRGVGPFDLAFTPDGRSIVYVRGGAANLSRQADATAR